ncbi:MAG: WhiB family transcriptional regulator [Mycobacterium sp.]|nr:WhiB family transcriptional regulator [Mycobacterium sp.]
MNEQTKLTGDTNTWTEAAACRGQPSAKWFPQIGNGADAKAICARCPVREPCLIAAVAGHETHGIWGGAGGDLLRGLERAYRARTHDPCHRHPDCTCRWCTALRRHFAALDGGHRPTLEPVVDRNGPNATHGRRVTYNRGCRCGACRFAATAEGQALDHAGIDTAAWWSVHDNPTSRYQVVNAIRTKGSDAA